MTRPGRAAAIAVALAAAVLLTQPCRAAQAAAAPAAHAQVLGIDGFWLSVANLDRSLGFYRNVLGLSLEPEPTGATALLPDLTAMPGARVRRATLREGNGPALQLVEFSLVPRRVLHPHSIDPGAAILEVGVTDLSRVLAAAKRAHTTVVTRGDAPVALPGGAHGIVLLDPDGFYVAISQAAQPETSLQMSFTVAAPATMVRFYQQLFGVTLRAGAFSSLGPWAQLLDERGAQWAVTQATPRALADAPQLRDVQFIAFRHVMRHTYSGRPQDPGTPALSLRVANMPAALRAIRAAGLRVLSAAGQPIPLRGGGTTILFRDPAGVLVDLVQH
ncbi:MAG TPA: VOC family protein [Steroidobacteraceae bacterium]|nr:VOC family protein [Steroidobacteraceae bacterium]